MEREKRLPQPRVPFGHLGLAIRHPLRGLGVQVVDSESMLPVAIHNRLPFWDTTLGGLPLAEGTGPFEPTITLLTSFVFLCILLVDYYTECERKFLRLGIINPTLTPPRRASLPFLRGGDAQCLPLKKGERKRGFR
jgi:hypothetical protein